MTRELKYATLTEEQQRDMDAVMMKRLNDHFIHRAARGAPVEEAIQPETFQGDEGWVVG